MGAEFLLWRHRPALLVILLFMVVCKMHLTSADNRVARVGKLYTRGNHWAVGHLMGKKGTGSAESRRISIGPPQEGEGGQPDTYSRSCRVRGLIGVLTGHRSWDEVVLLREGLRTGRERGRTDERDKNHDRGN